jgi:aminoglycoside phosphotransferase (APT) family kinase protein
VPDGRAAKQADPVTTLIPASDAPSAGAIDAALAARLIAAQFPQWSELPLDRVRPGGSDHAIFRLGDRMSVRLPLGRWAARQAEKEHRWLPRLAPHLPLPVPEPLGLGVPALGYPWHWSVSRWLAGETATAAGIADPAGAAIELAGFLLALQRLPVPGRDDPGRDHDRGDGLAGESLGSRDEATRAAIASARDSFDAGAMTGLWDAALAAPGWSRPPAWFHGDLHTGNLLMAGRRISAVIDFELGVGDPACDLMIAWTFLTQQTRPAFRAALGCDDATWLRGMGWGLTTGLNAYVSHAATNPAIARVTRHQISQALQGYAEFAC